MDAERSRLENMHNVYDHALVGSMCVVRVLGHASPNERALEMALSSLNVTTTTKLQFLGRKAEWQIKRDDLINVEGTEFLKLCRGGTNLGFPRLVFDVDDASSLPEKADRKLTASKGYQKLLDLRNHAQSQELISNLPSWQRRAAPLQQARPKRATRQSLRDQVINRCSIAITIPAVGDHAEKTVQVVRPVYSCEDLAVEFTLSNVEHIVAFIRSEGFDTDLLPSKRKPELPKGVYERSGQYLVTFPCGRSRTVVGLDEAITLVNTSRSYDDDRTPKLEQPQEVERVWGEGSSECTTEEEAPLAESRAAELNTNACSSADTNARTSKGTTFC